MIAKYYLYRNLHTGGFSIKQRGRVCERGDVFVMQNAEFRVSKAGQNRARKEQTRNVHAYMVADNYDPCKNFSPKMIEEKIDGYREVTYNPYTTATFVFKDTGESVTQAEYAIAINGKVYVK